MDVLPLQVPISKELRPGNIIPLQKAMQHTQSPEQPRIPKCHRVPLILPQRHGLCPKNIGWSRIQETMGRTRISENSQDHTSSRPPSRRHPIRNTTYSLQLVPPFHLTKRTSLQHRKQITEIHPKRMDKRTRRLSI